MPYVYGATLGAPSAGRPEKVLARLKTIESIWRDDCMPGEDGREGRVTAKGSLPRRPRNGLPEPGGYQYRGSGESLPSWKAEAVLTRGAPAPAARPAPKPRRKPEPRRFCPSCGAVAPDHLVICKRPGGQLPAPAAPGDERAGQITAADILPLLELELLSAATAPEPGPAVLEAAPALEPERRCGKCQYLIGTNGHKIMCGDG
jgi:hypothetical protein